MSNLVNKKQKKLDCQLEKTNYFKTSLWVLMDPTAFVGIHAPLRLFVALVGWVLYA